MNRMLRTTDGKPQWKDWGDARLQQNTVVTDLYRKEMSLPLYQHASTKQAFEKSIQTKSTLKTIKKPAAGNGK